jgi:hypothetical protein
MFTQKALTWIQANPAFTALILWPTLTAIFTGIFRHRTPEELARLPRVAQYVVRFIAYTGIDSASLIAMLRGRLFPSAAKVPTSTIVGMLAFVALVGSPYRANARELGPTVDAAPSPRFVLEWRRSFIYGFAHVSAVAMLVGSLIVVFASIGCGPSQAAKDATATAYTAELLACVQDAGTRAEADACRQNVNTRYGVVSLDAGSDGAK